MLTRCSTEQESHDQFCVSYYSTKLIHENNFHERRTAILVNLRKQFSRRLDLTRKIEIEDQKSFVDSYLIFPRSWYLSEVSKCDRRIKRLENLLQS